MTAPRPVLGIIACQRTVGVEPAQAVMERYVRSAMVYADVAALIVPSLPDPMSGAEIDATTQHAEKVVQEFLTTPEGLELAEVFPRIGRGRVRRQVLDLVRAMADEAQRTEVA